MSGGGVGREVLVQRVTAVEVFERTWQKCEGDTILGDGSRKDKHHCESNRSVRSPKIVCLPTHFPSYPLS